MAAVKLIFRLRLINGKIIRIGTVKSETTCEYIVAKELYSHTLS
jgi:hypothetical protein